MRTSAEIALDDWKYSITCRQDKIMELRAELAQITLNIQTRIEKLERELKDLHRNPILR